MKIITIIICALIFIFGIAFFIDESNNQGYNEINQQSITNSHGQGVYLSWNVVEWVKANPDKKIIAIETTEGKPSTIIFEKK